MNKKLLGVLFAGFVLVFAFSVMPTLAFANDGEGSSEENNVLLMANDTTSAMEEKQSRNQKLRTSLQELKEQRKDSQSKRLEATKLKVCEQRKAKITAILNRSVTRAERQIELFTTISTRVKDFYAAKNLTVANYDELVAAVDAAKADAEANLATLKSLATFDCDAEDPKGNAEAFKLALESIRQDLKDYRTSVKNLIVAVKSSQSKGSSSEAGGDQ